MTTAGNIYTINIHKENQRIINKKMFKPVLYKYKNITVVHCYLNFPHNWTTWHLPKKLHSKKLKISFFDETKIIIQY